MAVIRREKRDTARHITSLTSQELECTLLCEMCDRFFDCERPERELIYSRRRMQQAQEALQGIKHTILVAGGKGGVGKSTCTANMAVGLALRGNRVSIVDQDLDGSSIPKLLGVMDKRMQIGENGLIPVEGPLGIQVVAVANLKGIGEAVIWFHDMRRNASEEFISHTDYGERDFLLVDLPPGTGSDNINIMQLIPDADGYVVVTAPSQVSQATARKAMMLIKKAKKRVLGIIENMSGFACGHCGHVDPLIPVGGGYALAKEQDVPFLGRIPLDPSLARACDEGTPFVQSFKESPTAKAIEIILGKVLAQVGDRRQRTHAESDSL